MFFLKFFFSIKEERIHVFFILENIYFSMKKEEIKYIDYQLIGLGLTLVTTIIGIIITYNQKLGTEKKPKLMTNKQSLILTYINRILILLIGILFLYVNYKFYELTKRKGKETKSEELQIVASFLAIISSIIALYVVTLSGTETIADVENPNI